MWESDIGCVVVTDQSERPVGMITDRDIAMSAYTRGAPLCNVKVDDAMANEVKTCSADTPLSEVQTLMRSARIRRVPVVDSEGMLVGIVTLGDLARSAQSSPLHLSQIPGVAKTLAGITQRRSGQVAAAE
jgi:CBS domain-containing protein